MSVDRDHIQVLVDIMQTHLALLEELRPNLPLEEDDRGAAKQAISNAAGVVGAVQKLLTRPATREEARMVSEGLNAAAHSLDDVFGSTVKASDTLGRAGSFVLSQISLDLHDLQAQWDLWLHENPDALLNPDD